MMSNGIGDLYQDWFYTPKNSQTSGTIKGMSGSETPKTGMSLSSLQKDDFLRLLLVQLRNQDPLNPVDNTEFVAQLAQFSSLEQMTQMNKNLEMSLEITANSSETINNAMMIEYFGKTVLAETAEFVFDGETEPALNFNLGSASRNVRLEILNGSGDIVRSIDFGALEQGNHRYAWDGLDDHGLSAGPGTYSFNIEAVDATGEAIEWIPMFAGVVEGISRKEGQSYLFAGGIYIPADKIRHVSESVQPSE